MNSQRRGFQKVVARLRAVDHSQVHLVGISPFETIFQREMEGADRAATCCWSGCIFISGCGCDLIILRIFLISADYDLGMGIVQYVPTFIRHHYSC